MWLRSPCVVVDGQTKVRRDWRWTTAAQTVCNARTGKTKVNIIHAQWNPQNNTTAASSVLRQHKHISRSSFFGPLYLLGQARHWCPKSASNSHLPHHQERGGYLLRLSRPTATRPGEWFRRSSYQSKPRATPEIGDTAVDPNL